MVYMQIIVMGMYEYVILDNNVEIRTFIYLKIKFSLIEKNRILENIKKKSPAP